MSHARLEQLPSELLSAIFTLFCRHCTPNDLSGDHDAAGFNFMPSGIHITWHTTLARICRTSKTLNAVVTPILYHVFVSQTPQACLDFVRLIHARPDLASHVKQAYFLHQGSICFPRDDVNNLAQEIDPSAPLRYHRVEPSPGVGAPPGRHASHEPGAFGQQLVIGTTVSLATNLEYLEVNTPPDGWHELNRLWPAKIPSLKTLSVITLETCKNHYSRVNLMPLLNGAPDLRFLSIMRCGSISPGLDLRNLTVLLLVDPKLQESDAVNLFSSLVNLQALNFHISNGFYPAGESEAPVLTLGQLFGAMQPTMRTLRYLRLSWMKPGGFLFSTGRHVISSLNRFSALEKLHIDLDCIYAGPQENVMLTTDRSRLAAFLPESVQSVLIMSIEYLRPICEDFIDFAGEVERGAFSNLRSFGMITHGMDLDQEMERRLDEAFGRTALTLFCTSQSHFESAGTLERFQQQFEICWYDGPPS